MPKEKDPLAAIPPAKPPKKGNECPISRKVFREKAKKALTVSIDGAALLAGYKEYESGSLGWFASQQIDVEVGGIPHKAQVGLNITLVKSKELPKEE